MAINDPRDIPGLVAWYSAEAETGYTDGAEMTGWTDLSGHGNNATAGTVDTSASGHKPFWQATTGSSAGPAIRFGAGANQPTGAYFSLPAMFAGATAAEVMATVKGEYATSTGQGNWIKTGTYSGGTHYPYGTTVYDDFSSSASRTIGTLGTINSWHRVNIWSAANDYAYRQDGASVFTAATNAVAWAAAMRIGNSGSPTAPGTAPTDTFEGYIGCVVLYSRKLTTTERADLDTWLAAHPSGGTAAVTPTVTLTGTAPSVTGSFDVTVPQPPPAVSLTGAAPGVTGSFSASVATPPVSVDLAGTAPKVTGSFSVDQSGVTIANLTGTAPAVSGSFGITASGAPIEVATDSVNRLYGMTLVTEWSVSVDGPVTTPTRQPAHDYAVATSLPEPTLVEGRPT